MKTNYLLQSKNRQKRNAIPVLAAGAFILFAALINFLFPDILSRSVAFVGKPVWKAGDYFGEKLSGMFVIFYSKEDLLRENLSLKRDLEETKILALGGELCRKELAEFKNGLFGGTGGEGKRSLFGNILVAPPRSLYDTFIIDIGEKDGVKKGNKVFAGGAIIGTISESFSDSSKVKMFSSAGEKIPVRVGDGAVAEAEGQGGGSFKITVPKGLGLKKGDIIFSPEISEAPIGFVEEITGGPEESFETIFFKLPVNVFERRMVEILIEN